MSASGRWSAAFLLAFALPAASQDVPRDASVVPGGTEVVVVDVVVVDQAGHPVTDLRREEFVLSEAGQPQAITHFEQVRVEQLASARAARSPVSTNAPPPSDVPAAMLAIVFDERHLHPETVPEARRAVDALLSRPLGAGDEVVLLATGRGELWTARNEVGLDALRARLRELRGLRRVVPEHEAITEYEAYRIAVFEDRQALFRVIGRIGDLERARGGLITADPRNSRAAFAVAEAIERRARPLARQVWGEVSRRANVTLAALEGLAQALGTRKGRKTAVLVTEGFVADTQSMEWKRTLEAARRSNLVVYGLDARGLRLDTALSAETGRKAVFLGNDGTGLADLEASEGSDTLATETGGTVRRNTNALDDALLEISAEGRNYYLLGYQPTAPPDDKYRRLSVEVRRPGLTVRARKGYYALRARAPAPRSVPLPLRLTAYVGQPRPNGSSYVQVIGEIDPGAVEFKREGERWTAAVDWVVDVFTPGREAPQAEPRRLRLGLTTEGLDSARRDWIPLGADFDLPSGAHVARFFVRDEKGGRSGAVDHVFEVPAPGALHVTTVLSDLQRAAGSPAPALIARRTFSAGSRLLCQFEVHNAASAGGSHRVRAGHEVRTAAGEVIGRQEPSPLADTADGRLARLLVLSLEKTLPGRYVLVVRVHDEVSGTSIESVEPFEVIAAVGRPAS